MSDVASGTAGGAASGPMCEAYCEFSIAAARHLTGVPANHPCARMHGHTFNIRLTVRGPIDPQTGFVVDFAEIQRAWAPINDQLDHQNLNLVAGLENPTSENLARWIWASLKPKLSGLDVIQITETGNSGIIFRG